MARNEEKAQMMLNRFVQGKKDALMARRRWPSAPQPAPRRRVSQGRLTTMRRRMIPKTCDRCRQSEVSAATRGFIVRGPLNIYFKPHRRHPRRRGRISPRFAKISTRPASATCTYHVPACATRDSSSLQYFCCAPLPFSTLRASGSRPVRARARLLFSQRQRQE